MLIKKGYVKKGKQVVRNKPNSNRTHKNTEGLKEQEIYQETEYDIQDTPSDKNTLIQADGDIKDIKKDRAKYPSDSYQIKYFYLTKLGLEALRALFTDSYGDECYEYLKDIFDDRDVTTFVSTNPRQTERLLNQYAIQHIFDMMHILILRNTYAIDENSKRYMDKVMLKLKDELGPVFEMRDRTQAYWSEINNENNAANIKLSAMSMEEKEEIREITGNLERQLINNFGDYEYIPFNNQSGMMSQQELQQYAFTTHYGVLFRKDTVKHKCTRFFSVFHLNKFGMKWNPKAQERGLEPIHDAIAEKGYTITNKTGPFGSFIYEGLIFYSLSNSLKNLFFDRKTMNKKIHKKYGESWLSPFDRMYLIPEKTTSLYHLYKILNSAPEELMKEGIWEIENYFGIKLNMPKKYLRYFGYPCVDENGTYHINCSDLDVVKLKHIYNVAHSGEAIKFSVYCYKYQIECLEDLFKDNNKPPKNRKSMEGFECHYCHNITIKELPVDGKPDMSDTYNNLSVPRNTIEAFLRLYNINY
ncbi:MAG: hypothetical protein PUF72_05520 [Clostridiales bacterium]|nr:hypothetical protein [Clostridiales bacterium]